jgi:hypothetical protein
MTEKGKFRENGMIGDISGAQCNSYFRGIDGLGTCNCGCQWWPKDKDKKPMRLCCPWWLPEDQWDDETNHPKNMDRMYTWEEFETKFNTEIKIRKEGE